MNKFIYECKEMYVEKQINKLSISTIRIIADFGLKIRNFLLIILIKISSSLIFSDFKVYLIDIFLFLY